MVSGECDRCEEQQPGAPGRLAPAAGLWGRLGYYAVLCGVCVAIALGVFGHLRMGTWGMAAVLVTCSVVRCTGWPFEVPKLGVRSAWVDASVMLGSAAGLILFIEGIPLS